MDERQAAAQHLLHSARQFLDRDDREGLAHYLRLHWTPDCIGLFLRDHDHALVEVALVGLGLIGDMSHGPAIAEWLGHENPILVDAAEDALWSIWFRDGGPVGQAVLYRIEESMSDNQTENAAALLTELIRALPAYAEAYHQRGQVRYIQNEFALALRDAIRVRELNPLHYPAVALAGHCYSALGRYQEALKTYREALRIHPQMAGIRDTMRQIQRRLHPAADIQVPA